MLGLWDKVTPVIGRIEEACQWLAPLFDLVFIDGAHDAESVARDTNVARTLTGKGGVLVWHDWNYESVREGAGRIVNLETCKPLVGALAIWSREDNG